MGCALLSLRERATAPALLPTWRGFWNIWSRKTQPLQLLRRRTAFAAAAPTLQLSLIHICFSKEELAELLEELGWDTRVRGEALGLEEFAALTDKIAQKKASI